MSDQRIDTVSISNIQNTARVETENVKSKSRKTPIFGGKKTAKTSQTAEEIAQLLKDDIYAKKLGFIPTTGENIAKHVKQITPENVIDVLNTYKKINGDDESLFKAILGERGLPEEEREAYVKHIFYARLNKAKKHGMYIKDIKKSFDEELKKNGLIRADFLDALYEHRVVTRSRMKNKKQGIEKDIPNGKIDKDFKQGRIGDCWVLAGIRALSHSSKGSKILNDSLKVLDDGSVEVILKGAGKKYVVSQKEIRNAREFSTGDADVRALEIAINRYIQDVGGVYHGNPDIVEGNAHILYDILTGKGGKNFFQRSRLADQISGWFTDAQIDGFAASNSVAVVAIHDSSDGKVEIIDDEGNKVELFKNHAMAVIASDKDNVYIENPHNTLEIIGIPRETFKSTFNSIDEFYI